MRLRLLNRAPTARWAACRTVAAGVSHGSYVRLIDANTGKTIDQFSSGAGWVQALAFSPDGETLAWGTAQHLVHLRDVPRRYTRRTLRGHHRSLLPLRPPPLPYARKWLR